MKILIYSLSILVLVLLISCISCSSESLTEKEATQIIREGNGYPELRAIVLKRIEKDSALGQEIKRLVKEGYLIPPKKLYRGMFEITDKGKGLVRKCYWNFVYQNYEVFLPYTHTIDIVGVEEILVDSSNNTAVVRYKVGFSPTKYFDQLRAIDKQTIDKASQDAQKTYEKEILLKKWDQGWRVYN